MAKSDVLIKMKADVSNYDANIAKARKQLEGFKKDNLSVGGVMKQVSGSMVSMAAQYASVAAAIGGIGMAFRDNIETARNFEKSMSQLSSLTGMVGQDLEKLKGYAIELGASTTLSASQVADAFKMIGSQQPQLLESGEALKEVTKNAITLAEAAGIELSEAAQTLSVSINQMGGDSSNAERYINVLAAAAQKGAGDIVWLGEAITKSGTTAKAVGTDYEELVANLEQLAKAGYDASTAGTALRSIIMNLEKQANNNYKPSVVGLTQAFKNLGDAHLSIVEYQEIAGKMFAAQAKALADAAGEADNMRIAITGTNTAEEQAKTNTDNLDGSLKALASAWEGLNLHINSSNGFLRDCVDTLHDVIVWIDKALPKLNEYWNKSKWMLNPSKAGAQESMVQHLGDKYGWEDDAEAKRAQQKKQREEKSKQLRKYAYEHNVTYNGRYITKAEYEAEFGSSSKGGDGGGGGSTNKTKKTNIKAETTKLQENQKKINKLTQEYVKLSDSATGADMIRLNTIREEIAELEKRNNLLKLYQENAQGKYLGGSVQTTGLASKGVAGADLTVTGLNIEKLPTTKLANDGKSIADAWKDAAGSVREVGDAFSQIKDPTVQASALVAKAIATIAVGFAQATESASATGIFGWIASLTSGAAAMMTAIGAIHSATGYAGGGEIKGNTYSGDNIMAQGPNGNMIGLNANEIVLNRAQSNILASQLQNSGGGAIGNQKPYVTGDFIFLGLQNYLQANGYGKLVTTNMR